MPDGSPIAASARIAVHRPPPARAFSITELLIVIAIIAILIAILIPALSRARELARITKCMANQRTIGQAVHGFAAEHQGYGQLVAGGDSWRWVGYHRNRYVYEDWPWGVASMNGGKTFRVVSPWPVAYGSYIGVPRLKTIDFIRPSAAALSRDHRTIGRRGSSKTEAVRFVTVDALQCPSDRELIGEFNAPTQSYARISYGLNWDIFGHSWGFGPGASRRKKLRDVWRQGKRRGGFRLEGRLSGVVRPSDVLMFADAGGINRPWGNPASLHFLTTFGPSWSDNAGAWPWAGSVPHQRHGAKGGVVGVHVDGHATFLRAVRHGYPAAGSALVPTENTAPDGTVAPTHYSPNPRITPYEP